MRLSGSFYMKNITINIDAKSFVDLAGRVLQRFTTLSAGDVFFIVLAVLVPPIAVAMKMGIGVQFWVNVLLTILGVVPGQIHALWIVLF